MVTVCEHTEVCRLRYRVWQVQQRHDSLLRQVREIDAQLEEGRTPKRLLEAESTASPFDDPASNVRPVTPPRPTHVTRPGPGGRRDLRWFEFQGGAR